MAERSITVSDISNIAIGAMGAVINPSSSKTWPLRDIQGYGPRVTELADHVERHRAQVSLDGEILSFQEVALLGAPLSAELGTVREVFNNLAAPDDDAYKTAFEAPAAETTYSGSDLTGVKPAVARNFTITGTTGVGEDLGAKDVVIVGKDVNGAQREETLSIGALVASSTQTWQAVLAFTEIISVTLGADVSGTLGDYEFGWGSKIGLNSPLTQGGLLAEWEDNTVPGTLGTVVLAGASAPNGTYLPNTAPNDAHDYVIAYIPN